MSRLRRMVRGRVVKAVVIAALAAGGIVTTGSPALACVADPAGGGCYNSRLYYVDGTDGTLAVQQQPHGYNVTRYINEGDAVQVVCQVNWGTTADGVPSHTWDFVSGSGWSGWVYDHYITTPLQDSHGWSPGIARCDLPAGPLATNVTVPNLAVDAIAAAPSPAHVFKDGAGYFTSTAVRGLTDGGACQDFVMANTDFWWLWDSWDGFTTLNNVFTWAATSQAYGRTVSSTPVVGAIVVFNGGAHGPWDYGTGHVAVVVKVNDSASFTVAEYNWHAGGGGYGVMDFRRVAMNVGAVSAFIR